MGWFHDFRWIAEFFRVRRLRISSKPSVELASTLDHLTGIEVRTVITADKGPETAIIDASGCIYPVERYTSPEAALRGHRMRS